jgi:hypothetical protein
MRCCLPSRIATACASSSRQPLDLDPTDRIGLTKVNTGQTADDCFLFIRVVCLYVNDVVCREQDVRMI